jgi:hypothetical protein
MEQRTGFLRDSVLQSLTSIFQFLCRLGINLQAISTHTNINYSLQQGRITKAIIHKKQRKSTNTNLKYSSKYLSCIMEISIASNFQSSRVQSSLGYQKGCPYLNFSKCECVKQVHCLNKIKYDFTKYIFNLLHL